MKVKSKLRLEQEKILHDDTVVKRSSRYDEFYESICGCTSSFCGSYCTSKIGSGLNGSIRISRHKKTQKMVAVKRVKASPRAGHEITLHYMVAKKSTANFVQIIDIFLNTDSRGDSWFYVVLEYCPDGDLFKLLKSRPNGFAESDIFYLARQIVDMLNALRVLGIAHCDVKPENILVVNADANALDENANSLPLLKLADFGFARDVSQPNSSQNYRKMLMYTPNYVAPEVLLKRDYGYPCDVWALGVIMFVMATGSFPDTSDILGQIQANEQKSKNRTSLLLVDLLERIFNADPKQRINIPEIMNHEWWIQMSSKQDRKARRESKKSKNKSAGSPSVLSRCSSSTSHSTSDESNRVKDGNNNEVLAVCDVKSNQTSPTISLKQCSDANGEVRITLKKGEKYTWSESDLKSLHLEDSDNGSDKIRSGKSSRSSRRHRADTASPVPNLETEILSDTSSSENC